MSLAVKCGGYPGWASAEGRRRAAPLEARRRG
jgi:hypothetical protein